VLALNLVRREAHDAIREPKDLGQQFECESVELLNLELAMRLQEERV
jgi:hypothetical protein